MKTARQNKLGKIVRAVKKHNSFLITAHRNLEGDALGSELALFLLLKKLRKKVVVCNHDKTPEIYNFLPGTKSIKNQTKKKKFDVAFVLDCSDSSRPGRVKEKVSEAEFVINIDHHVSNTRFGDINWVEPSASSVCEMIYWLAKKLRLLDKRIALCLYTGIATDTGNFTYANTGQDTHRIAASLLGFGIEPHTIYEKLHSLCVFDDLKFIGKYIAKLKFTPDKKICWAVISRWQEKNYDLTEVLFSTMRLLKGPLVFLLFKKVGKEKIRVNFRSRSGIDVNKVAKFFGGGGHKRASGTTLPDNLKDAEGKVVTFLREHINEKSRRKK